MDPITIGALIIGGYVALRRILDNNQSPAATTQVSPGKIIVFIGAANAGKSSTINAVIGQDVCSVGPSLGTTKTTHDIPYLHGYIMRDTPGFMDRLQFEHKYYGHVKNAQLVVYVCSGQLYAPELEMLRKICHDQQKWNSLSGNHKKQKTILYVNKEDKRHATETMTNIELIRLAIFAQTSGILSKEDVIFGSSSPFDKSDPIGIDQLTHRIAHHLGFNLL